MLIYFIIKASGQIAVISETENDDAIPDLMSSNISDVFDSDLEAHSMANCNKR